MITRSQQELLLARSLLDAAELDYFIENDLGSVLVPSLDPVRIMVRADQADAAASVLGVPAPFTYPTSGAIEGELSGELTDGFVWQIPLPRRKSASGEALKARLPALNRSFNVALAVSVALLGMVAVYVYPRMALRTPEANPLQWMYRHGGASTYFGGGAARSAWAGAQVGDTRVISIGETGIKVVSNETTISTQDVDPQAKFAVYVSVPNRERPAVRSGPVIQEIRGTRREEKPTPERPRVF